MALTCIAAAAVWRDANRRAATPRLVGTMSLFLLAISFVHFGGGHAQQVWSRELAFHHAAIPLALLVLLQDYRFVLLDAFLRFLANVLLAGLFVSGARRRLEAGPAARDSSAVRSGAAADRRLPAADRVRAAAHTGAGAADPSGVPPQGHGGSAAQS